MSAQFKMAALLLVPALDVELIEKWNKNNDILRIINIIEHITQFVFALFSI